MVRRGGYSPEQIITKLREAEVLLSQGKTVAQACKAIEVSEQTYYRQQKEYGGMDATQAMKLKVMLDRQSQASPAYLARGGTESPTETIQEGQIVAQRWLCC